MRLSLSIVEDVLSLDQNVSYTLMLGVTVSRRNIRTNKFGDCNWIRTHNHSVCKRTLNHLAKLGKLATIECGINLKRVHDMIRTYSQTDSD